MIEDNKRNVNESIRKSNLTACIKVLEKKYPKTKAEIKKLTQLKLELAREPIISGGKRKRQGITKEVQHNVWRRDEGRCVECGSKEKLEFDHIIPHSKGGSDTERNIQLLCEKCNRSKHAKI